MKNIKVEVDKGRIETERSGIFVEVNPELRNALEKMANEYEEQLRVDSLELVKGIRKYYEKPR